MTINHPRHVARRSAPPESLWDRVVYQAQLPNGETVDVVCGPPTPGRWPVRKRTRRTQTAG